MSQILLIGSYIGLSDFVYEAECTGRLMSFEEVVAKNLVDIKELKRNNIRYDLQWYEIKPGDRVKIRMVDEEGKKEFSFFIQRELPEIPQTLQQFAHNRQHDYLAQHCKSE